MALARCIIGTLIPLGKAGFQLGGGLHKPCNLAVDLLPEGHVFRAKVWVITVATGRLTGGFVNAALVWSSWFSLSLAC